MYFNHRTHYIISALLYLMYAFGADSAIVLMLLSINYFFAGLLASPGGVEASSAETNGQKRKK